MGESRNDLYGTSYPSFRTLIGDLQAHGKPSRIDRSVLKRFSGAVGTQLITTLRFLGLIDDQGQPTPRLDELVAAFGAPEWGVAMSVILREGYAPLFALDLASATASHFDETFRKSFPGSDNVLQKAKAANRQWHVATATVARGRPARPRSRCRTIFAIRTGHPTRKGRCGAIGVHDEAVGEVPAL